MKLLTLARDLKRRKARERQSLFVAEGVRAVEELVRSTLEIRGVIAGPQVADAPRGGALLKAVEAHGAELTRVTDAEFRSAAETDSPQGILAIAAIPVRSLETLPVTSHARLLILDAVQDPGNIGTILRTAAAFGLNATLALPGTVDLWNAKVVRAAMGAHFHHPAFHVTPDDLFAFLQTHGIEFWGADGTGESVDAARAPERLALAVGNEGSGLTRPVRARVARNVSIPMDAAVDSLNVAVATGIILHRLRL